MGTLDEEPPLDNEINGEPHFYNVPVEWLPHLGRLAVMSGRMESAAMDIGGALGVEPQEDGKSRSVRASRDKIKKRLNAPPPPDPPSDHWWDILIPGWSDRVRRWLSAAPTAIDETRSAYLHGHYAHQYVGRDEMWVPVRTDALNPRDSPRVTVEDLEAAVRRLRPLEIEGTNLSIEVRVAIQEARERHRQREERSLDGGG